MNKQYLIALMASNIFGGVQHQGTVDAAIFSSLAVAKELYKQTHGSDEDIDKVRSKQEKFYIIMRRIEGGDLELLKIFSNFEHAKRMLVELREVNQKQDFELFYQDERGEIRSLFYV